MNNETRERCGYSGRCGRSPLSWILAAAISVGAWGIDPPANTGYRATDDKLFVWGTDNDFQAKYDSLDNRWELQDAAGNTLVRVVDSGTTGIVGVGRVDVILGSVATQITSEATVNRAVTLPDAPGQITLLGQDIASSEIVDSTIVAADLATGAVTSAKILDGEIVNADINASAAIALSKISTGSGTNGQIATLVAGVWAPANASALTGVMLGPGPTTDNAIPRMNGTGGYTLQGYTSNTPTISDIGLLKVTGGVDLGAPPYSSVPGVLNLYTTTMLIDALSGSSMQWNQGYNEARWGIALTGAESGLLGGSAFAYNAFDNDGNYDNRAMMLYRNPVSGVEIGDGIVSRPLYVRGDIYAGVTNLQVTSSGKVLITALNSGGATTGQFLKWDGINSWIAADGSVDWTRPGAIGSVTPNTGNFTSLTTVVPIADASVADTQTIGASSTVADAALSANVAHLNVAETIASDWVNTANPWADNEVADTLTSSVFSGNYVASVANGNGITGGAAGSNAAALTLALDQTAALTGDHSTAANTWKGGVNGIIFEGATADLIESYLTVADPAATDKTWTLPNTTGTLITTGDSGTVTDAMASDTLTASLFVGAGSTTTAVDLATAEAEGLLDSAKIDQSLSVATLNASGNGTFGDVLINVGDLTVAHTGNNTVLIDAGGSAFLIVDRGGTASVAYQGYYTAGTANWWTGMFGADGNFEIGPSYNGPGVFTLSTTGNLSLLGTATINGSAIFGDAAADTAQFNANTISFEGATADAFETIITPADVAADIAVAGPIVAGTFKTRTPIWLSAAALTPTTTAGCTAPSTNATDSWIAPMAASTNGFFQIVIPADYDGSTESVTLWYYKSDTNAVTWSISEVDFADNVADTTTYNAAVTQADTPVANNIQAVTISAATFFGTTANAGKLCKVKVGTNAYTGTTANFMGLKIEY